MRQLEARDTSGVTGSRLTRVGLLALKVGQRQVHSSIKKLLFGDHPRHDVLDLRSAVPGLPRVRVSGQDTLVELESLTQVLRLVVRRMGRCVLYCRLASVRPVSFLMSFSPVSRESDVAAPETERGREQVCLEPH
jgi:hypothetical protein